MAQFVVPERCGGWTVRDFLRECGVSSSAVRRAKKLEDGLCADGCHVCTSDRVQPGQTLTLKEAYGEGGVEPQDIPLSIVYEDAESLVFDKPAGIAVHPTLNYSDGTMANAYAGLMRGRGEETVFRPIYRLDKDTSGLLLVAKTALTAPFLARSCKKEYVAVIEGRLSPRVGRIEEPIARRPDSIILRRVDPAGQYACTDYRVLAENDRYSLVRFSLVTGRTHQIRVHMAYRGCPLAGDELYGGHRGVFPKQALHCETLCFAGTDGVTHRCESPAPAEWLDWAELRINGEIV